jgi:hypothetical protein
MYNKITRCLLITCAIIFSLQSKSQIITGLQAGINLASLSGPKDYDENKLKIGISAYAYLDFPLGKFNSLSLETGMAISQQGMKHTKAVDNVASVTTTTTVNSLDYVIMPIYIKENFEDLYAKIGPYGAYCISAKSKWKSIETQSFQSISDPKTGHNADYENNVRPYDFGLSFGFGFINYFKPRPGKFKFGRKLSPVVLIDFRYNIALVKIGLNDNVPNMQVRNQTFTLGITITSVRH